MTRTARALAGIVLTGAVVLLGATGCGRLGGADETTDVTWDGQALQAIGYTTEDVKAAADPAPADTGQAGGKRRPGHARLRFAFNHRTLHAEGVVQTDEGTKTVVVQRGSVTAVDATSVTVKSTDGFTLTWKVGDPIKVVANRSKADMSAVTVGAEVGIAGAKDGGTTTARLIVIPQKK
jgi:hypothetical protein